jgi:hypothetical protein
VDHGRSRKLKTSGSIFLGPKSTALLRYPFEKKQNENLNSVTGQMDAFWTWLDGIAVGDMHQLSE